MTTSLLELLIAAKNWKRKEKEISRYPDGKATPIDKLEFSYSESRKAYAVSAPAVAPQFPLKLAWAITAHKI